MRLLWLNVVVVGNIHKIQVVRPVTGLKLGDRWLLLLLLLLRWRRRCKGGYGSGGLRLH